MAHFLAVVDCAQHQADRFDQRLLIPLNIGDDL
jgi:hypothetical protein